MTNHLKLLFFSAALCISGSTCPKNTSCVDFINMQCSQFTFDPNTKTSFKPDEAVRLLETTPPKIDESIQVIVSSVKTGIITGNIGGIISFLSRMLENNEFKKSIAEASYDGAYFGLICGIIHFLIAELTLLVRNNEPL